MRTTPTGFRLTKAELSTLDAAASRRRRSTGRQVTRTELVREAIAHAVASGIWDAATPATPEVS